MPLSSWAPLPTKTRSEPYIRSRQVPDTRISPDPAAAPALAPKWTARPETSAALPYYTSPVCTPALTSSPVRHRQMR
jgi:hypothetical protein